MHTVGKPQPALRVSQAPGDAQTKRRRGTLLFTTSIYLNIDKVIQDPTLCIPWPAKNVTAILGGAQTNCVVCGSNR
eukprot:XP_001705065.1 Hypothetical protein GL50803_31094 [Giardia lamblia ATCC 50803]